MRVHVSLLLAAPLLSYSSQSAATISQPQSCGTGPSLLVNVVDLKDRQGRIVAELYPANAEDFLKDRVKLEAEGKVFRRIVGQLAPTGAVQLCVTAPEPGAYALIIIHDRDGANKFSIGKDGVGLPAAQSIGAARPRLNQARVTFGSSLQTMRVRMQYLRGLRGFALADR